MRKKPRIAVQHPREIHALEDLLRQNQYFAIGGKIRLRGQHAAEEERAIDARNLGTQSPDPGVDVEEVVEPAVIVESVSPEVAQRGGDPCPRLLLRNPAVARADAQGSQAKSSGGDAADVFSRTRPAHACPVVDNTGCGPCLLYEIGETALG